MAQLLPLTTRSPAIPIGVADDGPSSFELFWYRVRWWSPEARALRHHRRHAADVVASVARLTHANDSAIEAAVQQAFLALHRWYVQGGEVPDIREWTTRHALMLLARPQVH